MNIMNNSVMVRLAFNRIGAHKKANKEMIESGDTEKDSITLGKKLFTCDEYHAIGKADGQVKRWLLNRAIQVPLGYTGVYILPLSLIGDVDERLEQFKAQRSDLVESFLDVYDHERERARIRLGRQFNDADYPPKSYVRQKFGMEWRYVTFKVPETLPPEIMDRELTALRKSVQETETEVRAALREGLADLVGHLAERLEPDPDGNRKVFRNSAVENLVEFLDLIGKRDITDDGDLRALSDRAKQIIGDHTPENLREFSDTQKSDLAASLKQVAEQAGELVVSARRRKFSFDE
jgi:hypothetical protein